MSPTSPHQGIDLHLETGRAVLHGNATLRSTFSNRGALWSRSWSCERAASRATEKNIVICCSFMFQIRHPSVSWAPFEHFVAPSCVYPVYWGELFFLYRFSNAIISRQECLCIFVDGNKLYYVQLSMCFRNVIETACSVFLPLLFGTHWDSVFVLFLSVIWGMVLHIKS